MSEFRFLLDSNICIYLLTAASSKLLEKISEQDAGTLCCSAINLTEIAVGYGARARDAADLGAFLNTVPTVPFDEAAARIYGTLSHRRAAFDWLIAAHALSLDLTLVTNNEADFADVPRLKVENWTL